MGESRRPVATTEIARARPAPRWAVAAWRGARVAASKVVAAFGKADDEARARDRDERVFHPREH